MVKLCGYAKFYRIRALQTGVRLHGNVWTLVPTAGSSQTWTKAACWGRTMNGSVKELIFQNPLALGKKMKWQWLINEEVI